MNSKQKITVSGWGATEMAKTPDILMIAEQTPRKPTATCNGKVFDIDRMLQFNKEGEKWIGVASGDSGGKYLSVRL